MPDPRPGFDPRMPHQIPHRPPPPPTPPPAERDHMTPYNAGQVDNSINWSLMLKMFWILIIAPINIYIGAALLGYEFDVVDRKLMSISKAEQCEHRSLKPGKYTHHDGITVDIPTAGIYEICTEPFLWRFDK